MADFQELIDELVHHPALVPTPVEELAARSRRRRTRGRSRLALGAAILLAAGTAAALVVPLPHAHTGQPVATGTPGWSPITVAPVQGHWQGTALWTGLEMLVWGPADVASSTPVPGSLIPRSTALGLAYNPTTNSWRKLPPVALSSRLGSSAVWTGKEMIVWGGETIAGPGFGQATPLADGGAYNPSTNTWRILSPSPDAGSGLAAVWTGREMIIVGGKGGTGAAYDPSTNAWRVIAPVPFGLLGAPRAIWSGSRMVVVGSAANGQVDAASYDPVTNAWATLPAPPIGSVTGEAVVWTGKEMIVWGGEPPVLILPGAKSSRRPTSIGVAYSPSTNSWRTLSPSPLEARSAVAAVWTGNQMIVWGGATSSEDAADGAAYDPTSDTWSQLPSANLNGRYDPLAVWTGRQMIVWGGVIPVRGPEVLDGASYTPAATP